MLSGTDGRRIHHFQVSSVILGERARLFARKQCVFPGRQFHCVLIGHTAPVLSVKVNRPRGESASRLFTTIRMRDPPFSG